MSETAIEIQGLPELNVALAEIAKGMRADAVEPVLLRAAQMIANAVRGAAPQGPTGNLRRSVVGKLLQRRGQGPASALVAIDYRVAPHARVVEFGTGPRLVREKMVMFDRRTGIFYGRQVGPVPARPFFRPAAESRMGAAREQIMDELTKLIEQGWNR